MDPDEIAKLFGSTEEPSEETYDATAFDQALRTGTMGEFKEIIKNEPTSVQTTLIKQKEEIDKNRISDVSIVSDATRNIEIIDDLLKTEDYKWVGGDSQKYLGQWGLSSVIPGMNGFGSTQAKIEKLNGSIFMSQIPQMSGLGALSNAEGSRIVEAVTTLTSAVPDKDGNYKNAIKEEDIKKELLYLKDRFEKIQKRLTSGQRVHPTEVDVNGDPVIMSSEQFNREFPQLANEPAFVAGEEPNNNYNLKDKTELNPAQIKQVVDDFRANAPEGAILVLPDGRSYRKPKSNP